MITKIYIDVPHSYKYDFSLNESCEKVVQRQEGIKGTLKFMVNSGAGLSSGDLLELTFDEPQSEGDIMFFRIKHGFDIIDPAVVEQYFANRDKRLSAHTRIGMVYSVLRVA
jgi:hypothetical protein